MILSVSRRTDIPAFYSDWFYNRIREGNVCVRNPMNRHQVSKIRLSPDVIDCIVFWSKNPAPMLPRLDEFVDYMYYFQFTVTPYDRELEKGLPQKESVIDTFRRLSGLAPSGLSGGMTRFCSRKAWMSAIICTVLRQLPNGWHPVPKPA